MSKIHKPPVDEILDQVGGDFEACRICKLTSTEALRHWRKLGKIPPKHWPAIHAASRKKITYEMLAKVNKR